MQLGFTKDSFDEAEDGVKAWKLLSESRYDVILTDWNMPNKRRYTSKNAYNYDYN